MDLSIALYNNNLFSVDSYDFLPYSQYIFPSCNPSCLRLVNMCFLQFSLRSRYIAKYLASSARGILRPFSVTDGYVSLRVVNVTCINFVPFALILHFLNHVWTWYVIAIMLLCDYCELLVQLCRPHRLLLWNANDWKINSSKAGRALAAICYLEAH